MSKKMSDYYNLPIYVKKEVNEFDSVSYGLIDSKEERVGRYSHDEKEEAEAMAEFINSHDRLVEQLEIAMKENKILFHNVYLRDNLLRGTDNGETLANLESVTAQRDKAVEQLGQLYEDVKTTHNMILAHRFKEAETCCSHIKQVILESNHKALTLIEQGDGK